MVVGPSGARGRAAASVVARVASCRGPGRAPGLHPPSEAKTARAVPPNMPQESLLHAVSFFLLSLPCLRPPPMMNLSVYIHHSPPHVSFFFIFFIFSFTFFFFIVFSSFLFFSFPLFRPPAQPSTEAGVRG